MADLSPAALDVLSREPQAAFSTPASPRAHRPHPLHPPSLPRLLTRPRHPAGLRPAPGARRRRQACPTRLFSTNQKLLHELPEVQHLQALGAAQAELFRGFVGDLTLAPADLSTLVTQAELFEAHGAPRMLEDGKKVLGALEQDVLHLAARGVQLQKARELTTQLINDIAELEAEYKEHLEWQPCVPDAAGLIKKHDKDTEEVALPPSAAMLAAVNALLATMWELAEGKGEGSPQAHQVIQLGMAVPAMTTLVGRFEAYKATTQRTVQAMNMVNPPAAAEPPAANHPAAAEPPAANLPAAAEPPAANLPAAAEPPAANLPAAAEPPAANLPAAAEPPAANLPAAGPVAAGGGASAGGRGQRRPGWSRLDDLCISLQHHSPAGRGGGGGAPSRQDGPGGGAQQNLEARLMEAGGGGAGGAEPAEEQEPAVQAAGGEEACGMLHSVEDMGVMVKSIQDNMAAMLKAAKASQEAAEAEVVAMAAEEEEGEEEEGEEEEGEEAEGEEEGEEEGEQVEEAAAAEPEGGAAAGELGAEAAAAGLELEFPLPGQAVGNAIAAPQLGGQWPAGPPAYG
ncbi:hypothetical protein HYH03_003196 [Edaphochlamys debaryana]|uniref:Uncharacterized protein n=1 Tax=Edaphochlamys debaryana TaxID=47281 RepID=A0A835YI06_9CHLO|nr:hypothetical protein HYH03_003196 [Edaphochlamys debaryana]|eukprot:KAG2499010.1 hypothetical protein HYH03_003196 [Edaphochlamys debaryana]